MTNDTNDHWTQKSVTMCYSLNVRLTPEIHSSAAMAAQKAGMTINAFIKNAVARALGIAL